jgi:hypothetical protein
LGYVAGRFYRATSGNGSSFGSLAVTVNTTYYCPIYISSTNTFDRIQITTGSTWSGSGVMRLGIYNDSNGSPSTVLLDAGTVSPTAGNTTYTITISQSLDPGWYWLANNSQTAAATNSVYGVTNTFLTPNNFGTTGVNTNAFTMYTQSVTVTSGFATATSLTASNATFPSVLLRSA